MSDSLITLGWREWLSLPALELPYIAAKIDTGARTSCLHAFEIQTTSHQGEPWVRFALHPVHGNREVAIWREAKVVDQRQVTDSGGHQEQRFVISSRLALQNKQWDIEITLSNRDTMRFRMLLGRTAMNGHCQVNPAASWLLGKPTDAILSQAQSAWEQESLA